MIDIRFSVWPQDSISLNVVSCMHST